MAREGGGPRASTLWLAGTAAAAVVLGLIAVAPTKGSMIIVSLIFLVLLASLAYLAWYLDPAWLLVGALLLSTFNGNWGTLGLPGLVAPDRMLLLGALAAIIVRTPRIMDRPPLSIAPVHWLLGLTLAYAVGSAFAAGTITTADGLFGLLDRMAVPFVVFLLAPYAFRTGQQRRVLLGGLVAWATYLGLTALFETIGPRELVVPSYITDPTIQFHLGRARGPFVEAAINGFALYVGAVACAIAVVTWKSLRWRILAAAVSLLCTAGVVFTLTRSVWLGAGVATALTFLAVPQLRRFAVPVGAAAVAMVLLLFVAFPTVQDAAFQRGGENRSVWERENSNASAWRMLMERPVFGFGFDTFQERSFEYPVLIKDNPVTITRPELHNVYLALGTELGLVGGLLFVFSFLAAIGTAVLSRSPPDLYPWRVGLLAIAIAWAVIAFFVPFGQVFPNLAPWLFAAVIIGGRIGAAPQTAPVPGYRIPTRPPGGREPAPVT